MQLNLIGVFEFYLLGTFILSTVMRYRQYRAVVGFIMAAKNRWPKLVQLASQHRTVFLTWPTLLPVALTLALMLVHMLAYNLIWPSARVSPKDLWDHWPALVSVLVFVGPMLYLDYDATFNIWEFDQADLQPYLDKAEYWLRSWMAPALSIVTFGYVDPRKMVGDEVLRALTSACLDVNKMMWWWSVQIGMRIGFGLSLWLLWALALR